MTKQKKPGDKRKPPKPSRRRRNRDNQPAPFTGQPIPITERAYPHVDRAREYVEHVLSGAIVACHFVRMACARFLDMQKRDAFVFDPEKAERVCRFVEQLRHVKGKWAREQQRIYLQPWQCFLLVNVFGWHYAATGLRVIRQVYLEVPRKNAKSTLTSGVALYMLTSDGESGAECYTAATNKSQAGIVFEDAKKMARADRRFLNYFGVGVHVLNMSIRGTGSKFEPLHARAETLDGLNVSFACVDELHAHASRVLWDVIETGTGAREQPLVWAITSAGNDRAGICYEQRTYATKILNGVVDDPSVFAMIYTIDGDDLDRWDDPRVWAKANPNLGVSVAEDYLARLAKKAREMPSARATFLTKHLDVWVSADSTWLDMQAWDACADSTLRVEDFAGENCYIGLDLASKVDLCARVRVFERDGRYFVFGTYYLPEEAVNGSRNSQYSGWKLTGRLAVTPGNVTDFDVIERDLLADSEAFTLQGVGFDPYQARQLASHMIDAGLPMIEVRPTVMNFSEPMKQFEALVKQARIVHDGCPVLAWMLSNVVCHRDAKDNVYPRKEREENKIDGAVALLMAMNRALRDVPDDADDFAAYIRAPASL